ncbi:MAG: outer membrane protein assembly factor BamB family protein [Bacteroidales bacterium]
MKTAIVLISVVYFVQMNGCSGQSAGNAPAQSNLEEEAAFHAAFTTSRQWSAFRGSYARGWLDDADLPETWDVETMNNIRWMIPLPGLGLSSPVVWNNTIFITTAVGEPGEAGIKTGIFGEGEPVEEEAVLTWKVYAIDKNTGEVLWERAAHQGVPEVKRHPKSSHANPTVATDGTHVVAFFGSEGVYCYDFEGNLLWERDFGLLMSSARGADWAEWEFASSPLLYKDKLVIQADVKDNSFLAALDVESGEFLWQKERNDWPGWATPNLYFYRGRPAVAVNGYEHRGGYDLETGEEIWRMSGGGDVPIPTPILYKDLIFFNSAHGRQSPILAIRNDATGKIRYPSQAGRQDTAISWYIERGGAYMQTMLVYRDLLYNMRWNGNLSCYRASTGELLYRETVSPESFIASPVAADGRLYLVTELGEVHVIEAGPEYNELQMIPLGEVTLSTPAITDGMIIFRTTGHLIAAGVPREGS